MASLASQDPDRDRLDRPRHVVALNDAAAQLPVDKPTLLQALQLTLLDLVRKAAESDEQTALAFREFLVEIAAREAARGRWT